MMPVLFHHAGVIPRDQLAEARAEYRRALELFEELRERGTLMPNDTAQAQKLRAKLAATEETSVTPQPW